MSVNICPPAGFTLNNNARSSSPPFSLAMTQVPSLRFSSTIRFVSKDEFYKRVGSMQKMIRKRQYADWAASPARGVIGKRVQLKKKGVTTEAYDCNIQVVHNGDRLSLAHIHPFGARDYPVAVKNGLLQDISRLKKKGKPLRAFITGGRAFEDNNRAASSQALFRLLQVILLAGGVSAVSMVWGRSTPIDNGSTNVFYDTAEDTYYVYAESQRLPEVVTLTDLTHTFDVIRVAPGDTLELLNRTIKGPFEAFSGDNPDIKKLVLPAMEIAVKPDPAPDTATHSGTGKTPDKAKLSWWDRVKRLL